MYLLRPYAIAHYVRKYTIFSITCSLLLKNIKVEDPYKIRQLPHCQHFQIMSAHGPTVHIFPCLSNMWEITHPPLAENHRISQQNEL